MTTINIKMEAEQVKAIVGHLIAGADQLQRLSEALNAATVGYCLLIERGVPNQITTQQRETILGSLTLCRQRIAYMQEILGG
jgi:hypothetical protein